jgi:hypothetical protein
MSVLILIRFLTVQLLIISKLADIGGTLGLYFGLTIITIYEFVVFMCVDRELHEAKLPPEEPFTKRFLYKQEDKDSLANGPPIPTIF